LHPEQASFHLFLSRVQLQQGELQGAVDTLEQGLARGRPDAEYLATAAALHQRLGDMAKSAARYRQALALDPSRGTWWLGLAIALERLPDPAEAAKAYTRALGAGLEPKLAAYARDRAEALR